MTNQMVIWMLAPIFVALISYVWAFSEVRISGKKMVTYMLTMILVSMLTYQVSENIISNAFGLFLLCAVCTPYIAEKKK